MVFSVLEQIYLIKLLEAEETDQHIKMKQTAYFHKTMQTLKENGYVKIDGSNKKFFRLTTLGRMVASIVAKHTKTDPKYRQYAGTVIMTMV